MPMAAYGWTNAVSPVPTSFSYAVPPPPSYEEYEFSEEEKFFIDDDHCIYRPVGNGCPAIFKNGKPKGCPVGSLKGVLNQFGRVSLSFGNCNKRGSVKVLLNDEQ